jgi:hypothetical protein
MNAANITEAILVLIAEQSRKAIDLADMLGSTPGAINNRLRRLEATRQIHHTRIVSKTGVTYLWHIGPASSYAAPLPLVAEEEMEDGKPGIGRPNQKTVKSWAPKLIRNEFETFLFGPAHKEAA